MPEPSILDARLAEIDRRLRMIQSGLEPVPDLDPGPPGDPSVAPPTRPSVAPPVRPPVASPGLLEPPPLRAAPPPALPLTSPGPAGDVESEIAGLAARLHELTAVQERLLAATQDLLGEHADVLSRVAPTIGVSAGPFTETQALQDFQRALADLPQVRDVAIREYAGSERAVLDVHLWSPIS
jgi:hypothetical protein